MTTPEADSISLVAPDSGTLEDEFINGLVQGGSWTFDGPQVLTYSFNINDNGTFVNPQPGPGGSWTDPANAPIAIAVAQALTAWSNVANISFQQVTSGTYYFQSTADMAFTLTGDDLQTQAGAVGLAFFPDPDYAETFFDRDDYAQPEGDVFLDNYYSGFDSVAPGSTGFEIILHEIGHALGLKHASDDGGNFRPTFNTLGIGDYDSGQYTIMTTNVLVDAVNAATPMLLDILAIQYIYGANMTYHAGNDVYAIGNSSYSAIWDAGGTDALDASAWAGANGVLIDLNDGAFSGDRFGEKRLAIAYNAVIENAVGSNGNDSIVGNAAANALNGGTGLDLLSGGDGNDLYYLDDASPAPEVFFSLSFTGDPGDPVTGGGSYYFDSSFATYGYSVFNDGINDSIPSAVQLSGAGGGYGFVLNFASIGAALDLDPGVYPDAIEFPGNGLYPGITLVLGGGSHVSPTGTFTVTTAQISQPGPFITSLHVEFEQRDGAGGPATYAVLDFSPGVDPGKASVDSVVENADEGIDTVITPWAHTLQANVENLVLAGTNARNGTGNELDNVITGNSASNNLTGKAGNDTLDGGDGIDTANYSLESAAVIVNLSSGTSSSASAGADVLLNIENARGTIHADALTGNNGANLLLGGVGDDTLEGGYGVDTLDGGAGDDTHRLKATAAAGVSAILLVPDVIVENISGGLDTAYSASSYTLPDNVENLVLSGAPFWRPYEGRGNELDNRLSTEGAARHRLYGEGGNDTLDGGSGADLLDGGGGSDVFLFGTLPSADQILDFTSGTDQISLDNVVFTAFGVPGAVSLQNVQVGEEADISAASGDAGGGEDYLKYATDTGHLYYDADGTAAGALSLIATVYSNGMTPATLLPAQDLVIV